MSCFLSLAPVPSRGGDVDRFDKRTLRVDSLKALAETKLYGIGASLDDNTKESADGSVKVVEPTRSQVNDALFIIYVGRKVDPNDESVDAKRNDILNDEFFQFQHTVESALPNITSVEKMDYGGENRIRTWDDMCFLLYLDHEPCFSCQPQKKCLGSTTLHNIMYPSAGHDYEINRTGLYLAPDAAPATLGMRYDTASYTSCLFTHSYLDTTQANPLVAIPNGVAGADVYNNNASVCYSLNDNIGHCSNYTINKDKRVPFNAIDANNDGKNVQAEPPAGSGNGDSER